MRDDKYLAIKLRKSGKSYSHICKALGIPKSTLSEWFSNEEWSLAIYQNLESKNRITARGKIKSLNAHRQIKLERQYVEVEQEAQKEFARYKRNPLFIAGTMLYWGEGYKKFENGQVRVANTDPHIIKVFRNFLTTFGGYSIERIKGWILIYPDLKTQPCISYWSRETGILRSNFVKPTVIQGRHKTNRLSYGTCTIYVSDKCLKKKILKWIELYKKELVEL
jgi:hypothetical protein